ncbi:acyltransferase [Mucilaginibacter sp. R11]|uniref:Acyltransferase n=2 Tax=Mucilaginibacter agri TaxID=2695265 RepID=A0A965ZHD5_9SPHI|nr:acyltransferase [Mucilaginibacter agri]
MLLNKLGDNFAFEYPVILKGPQYIEIGDRFSSRSHFRIEAWDKFQDSTYTPEIKIGNNVIFNFNCHLGSINLIKIGNNVLVGSNVLITDHTHGEVTNSALAIIPSERPLYSKGAVIIEDNVWIGENVSILGNVHIGENSIIGANSVVTSNVPANCVVGGIPSKIIKRLV